MAEVNLNIHGRDYGIACDDGQESRVIEVGRYVDSRARDIASAGAASNENHLLVLTALVLADEIKELRENIQQIRVNGNQAFQQANGSQRSGLSPEEEKRIVESIEQLATRINSVATRMTGS